MNEESKQARALAEATDRLRRAQKAGRLGTWDWDVGTNELIWDGVENVHGLAPGSFGGTFEGYLKDMHPEDRERVVAAIDHARETGGDLSINYRIVRPDGSTIWVEGRGTCIADQSGRTVRMTGTCQDITDRKHAEAEKEDLFAFASHELRNPLTSILGYARMLERRIAANENAFDEETREAVRTISGESQRMAAIMEVFLDLARAESQRLEIEIEEFDLAEAIEEEADRVKLKTPDVEIEIDIAGPAPVRSDLRRVRQVLSNLLDNAVKYGGTPPRIKVRCERAEDEIRIYLRDNGGGIGEEDRRHLFERFYRGQAKSGPARGLGIGLYLSRQFVERLGGSLALTSPPEGETEFRLTLPAGNSARI